MNITLFNLARSVVLVGIMANSFSADAAFINISPSTTGIIPGDLGPANCEAGCVYDAFSLTNDGTLSLYYKSDVPKEPTDGDPATPLSTVGTDSGTFADSYKTTFSNTAYDPADALIEYISGDKITCPECYLAIKDGNQNPSYYFYNLTGWNGSDSLRLTGFWPQGGAISHVSIWGRIGDDGTPPLNVPEPSLIALMGFGLMGFGASRLRKKRKD